MENSPTEAEARILEEFGKNPEEYHSMPRSEFRSFFQGLIAQNTATQDKKRKQERAEKELRTREEAIKERGLCAGMIVHLKHGKDSKHRIKAITPDCYIILEGRARSVTPQAISPIEALP
ncbi:MAG: hypothetical protein Q7S62_03025 [bacterium]|nr:hypothetical protein [bacterium]